MLRLTVLATGLCLATRSASDEQPQNWHTQRYSWIKKEFELGDGNSQEGRLTPAQRAREAEATLRLQREGSATRRALSVVLDKAASDETRLRVIPVLKEMRSTSAVRPLIKNITLESEELRISDPLFRYPAASALAHIGQPALKEILVNRALLEASDEEIKLFAAVAYTHYAFDPAVGRFHVERALGDAQGQLAGRTKPKASPTLLLNRQQNLTRLLEFYDAIGRGELFGGFPRFEQTAVE